MCKKIKYRVRNDAVKKLMFLKESRNECGTYLCRDCGSWHLTSRKEDDIKLNLTQKLELLCKFREEHKTKTCFNCPNGDIWQKNCNLWQSVIKYV